MVAPAGIEPATHRASICCSTDWATEPWRSRRGSNPRSPPWQGGVLNHFTTGPILFSVSFWGFEPHLLLHEWSRITLYYPGHWLRRQDLNLWPSDYEPDELPTALLRDVKAHWALLVRTMFLNGGQRGIRTPAGREAPASFQD